MALDDTRKKILSVANKLFSRFGFHKTSMDEIVKIARKAKGSLYYHFASKEELFKEVVSKEIANLKNQLSIIVNNTDLNNVKENAVSKKKKRTPEKESFASYMAEQLDDDRSPDFL